jgi:uncharacterized membrane protein YbhN (UPF0104 family)
VAKLIGWVGATIGGSIGWWLGARVGIMTAFMVSAVGTGAGLYVARRYFSDYLG